MSRASYEPPSIQPHRPDLVNQFGRAAAHPVTSNIDGVPISDLAERFGSPLFVFSEKTLRARIAEFRGIFRKRYPKVRFGWSF
jgi:diaminopimelate decarboxylase